MNIRDHLNRRIIPVFAGMLACFVLFGAGGAIASGNPSLILVPFIGFVGFGAGVLFLYYGVRCPQCRNLIGQMMFLPKGGYFRLSRNIHFCPFCGISLDYEISKDGQPIVPPDAPTPRVR